METATARSTPRPLDAFETAVRAGIHRGIARSGLSTTKGPWLCQWANDLAAELRKIGAEVLTAAELTHEVDDAIDMGMAEEGFPDVQGVVHWVAAAVVEKCVALNGNRFLARSES